MGCSQSTPEDLSERYSSPTQPGAGGIEVGGDITYLAGYDSRKVMLKVILLGDSGYIISAPSSSVAARCRRRRGGGLVYCVQSSRTLVMRASIVQASTHVLCATWSVPMTVIARSLAHCCPLQCGQDFVDEQVCDIKVQQCVQSNDRS